MAGEVHTHGHPRACTTASSFATVPFARSFAHDHMRCSAALARVYVIEFAQVNVTAYGAATLAVTT